MSCHLQNDLHASLAIESAAANEREAALRHDLSAAREAEVSVMRSLQSELRRSVAVQLLIHQLCLGLLFNKKVGLLGLYKHHSCSLLISLIQNCTQCHRTAEAVLAVFCYERRRLNML